MMIKPCTSPTTVTAANAAGIVKNQGHPRSRKIRVMTTPPTALTKPIERSISPSSRTKTTPMAMVAIPAIWTIRLTKLTGVRKFWLRLWKMSAINSRPTMIGSDPMSPPRTRFQ